MKGDARREVQEVVPALWVAESRCKKRKGTVINGPFPFLTSANPTTQCAETSCSGCLTEEILLLRYDF